MSTSTLTTSAAVEARAATDRLKLTLIDAHEQLIDLYRMRAHEQLGYGKRLAGWTAYLAAEFGELLSVVPSAEQLVAMVDAGMSQREAAAPFRVSVGTVNAALKATRPAPAPAPVVVETRADQIVRLIAAAGAAGRTSAELERDMKAHHGIVSGALSRVARQGRVVHAGHSRGGYGIYLAASQ